MQLTDGAHRPQSWHLMILSCTSALLMFAVLSLISLYLPNLALIYAGVLLCVHFGWIKENMQVGYARVHSWIEFRAQGLKINSPVAPKQGVIRACVIRAWKNTLCDRPIAGTSMFLAKRAMLFNNPLDFKRALNDNQKVFDEIKDVVCCLILGQKMRKTMQNLMEYYALAHHALSPVKDIVYLIDNTIHQSFSEGDSSPERLKFIDRSRQFLCSEESIELFDGALQRVMWIPEKFYTTEESKIVLTSLGNAEQQKAIHHDLLRACVANLHIKITKVESEEQLSDYKKRPE